MRLFFSAGEASGDAYAAALLRALFGRIRALPEQKEPFDFVTDLAKSYGRADLAIQDDETFTKELDDLDSLGVVERVMRIEEAFGIELEDEDWQGGGYKAAMAALSDKVNAAFPNRIVIQAVGGRKVRAAGAQLVADSSRWGAIGIAESLRVYPNARVGLAKAQRTLRAGTPGVFVPIDYGYMNIGLARLAKSLGWEVVYFSPPGAWRKDKQGADLPKVTDAIITPFSWSAEILNRMGASAHWFGHPIKQMIREGAPSADAANPKAREGLAILPGSRRSEIDLLLPTFAKALEGFPETAEIAVAATVDRDALEAKWRSLAPGRDDVFTRDDTYGVLKRARAAIVCSGTATLEAALCRCPHVVAYKVSKAVEAQARLIRFKVQHIAQPNILLERTIVPELIQQAATPEAVRGEIRKLLDESEARAKQLEAFEALDRMLGPDDAIDKSADLIAGMLR